MKTRLVVLSCCITMAAILVFAQGADEGYQTAKVVAFERLAADAQHMADADRYKISMRMADTVYACRGNAPASVFLDWTVGKEFPAKLSGKDGKVLQVKNPNGQIVELTVTGKKTAK